MSINQAKEMLETTDNSYAVTMYEALRRLHDNPDFQKVILEGYFKDEPIRITSLLATDYVRREGVRPVLMEKLVAISSLEDYFQTIIQLGNVPDEDEEDEGGEEQ